MAGNRRGQSVVELALLLPVLLWLCAGIVDFGRVYHSDVIAINASRVGARIAADARKTDGEVVSAILADSSGLAVASVTISPGAPRTPGQTVTVTVRYSFTPITPVIGSLFPGGTLSVSRSASFVVF